MPVKTKLQQAFIRSKWPKLPRFTVCVLTFHPRVLQSYWYYHLLQSYWYYCKVIDIIIYHWCIDNDIYCVFYYHLFQIVISVICLYHCNKQLSVLAPTAWGRLGASGALCAFPLLRQGRWARPGVFLLESHSRLLLVRGLHIYLWPESGG